MSAILLLGPLFAMPLAAYSPSLRSDTAIALMGVIRDSARIEYSRTGKAEFRLSDIIDPTELDTWGADRGAFGMRTTATHLFVYFRHTEPYHGPSQWTWVEWNTGKSDWFMNELPNDTSGFDFADDPDLESIRRSMRRDWASDRAFDQFWTAFPPIVLSFLLLVFVLVSAGKSPGGVRWLGVATFLALGGLLSFTMIVAPKPYPWLATPPYFAAFVAFGATLIPPARGRWWVVRYLPIPVFALFCAAVNWSAELPGLVFSYSVLYISAACFLPWLTLTRWPRKAHE